MITLEEHKNFGKTLYELRTKLLAEITSGKRKNAVVMEQRIYDKVETVRCLLDDLIIKDHRVKSDPHSLTELSKVYYGLS